MKYAALKIYLLMLFLLFSFPLVIALTSSVSPTLSEGQMALDPQTATATRGENFDILLKAKIGSTANAKAVKTKIFYDASVLNVVGVTSLVPNSWSTGVVDFTTAGTIIFQKSCLSSCDVVNNEFNIARINFQAVQESSSGTQLTLADDTSTSDGDAADTAVLTGSTNHINSVSGSTITITACSAGQTDCSGTCVDTSSDEGNCGACGTSCTATQICSSSSCTDDYCGNDVCSASETVTSCTADCQGINELCQANGAKNDNTCEPNLDCILVRNNQYKCKNLDNGKVIDDGSLFKIKTALKSTTSLSQNIAGVANELRSNVFGDSSLIVPDCSTCAGDCIPKKVNSNVCANLDGTDPTKDLYSTDGSALGRIKSHLTSTEPLLKRLALIAKEFNELFS